MTATDEEARALIEQVFPPLPPLPPATCTTGRVVAVAAAGVALGAALGVAAVMVTDAVVRRLGRVVDEAELADWFPTGWLR